MKKILVSFFLVAFFTSMFISCYYDNEEFLYPELSGPCDTTNVTFATKIGPLINNNCLSCHSNANSSFGGGIRLQDPADVKTRSASIFAAISHTGPVPMPPGGKLSQCLIDQFGIWIRNGMPD